MRGVIIYIILFISLSANAQQEQLYTQFMFNKQLFNPAYVGNDEVAIASILMRDQWNGLEGAPKTQVVSFSTPLNNNRLGIGVNLVNHRIGLNERLNLDLQYSYRIKLASGTFSLGLQGSFRRYELDFADPRVVTTQSVALDPAIDPLNLSKSIFNFGFGVYYNTKLFYVGAAIPRLAEADLAFEMQREFSTEVRHMYLMGGAAFVLNPNVTFKPQALLKYAPNTPYDLDLNLGFVFKEKYTIASTLRTGGNDGSLAESLDLILSVQFNPQLMIGFAYDYTLSDLRSYQNGSLEVMAHYMFSKRIVQDEIINPRYF